MRLKESAQAKTFPLKLNNTLMESKLQKNAGIFRSFAGSHCLRPLFGEMHFE